MVLIVAFFGYQKWFDYEAQVHARIVYGFLAGLPVAPTGGVR
jgi:hypothetical protein